MTRLTFIWIQLCALATLSFSNINAQILVQEDIQSTENAALLHTTDGKLFTVTKISEDNGVSYFAVSAKVGNAWKRYGAFKALPLDGNKNIEFTDIEVFADKIYLSGNFMVPGTKTNCLLTLSLASNPDFQWKAEYEFISNTKPQVNALALAEDKLFIAGNFTKIGSLECNNLARMNKNKVLEPFRVGKNIGGNGAVHAMETDTLKKSLFIAGNFRNIGGEATDGFVRFRVADSVFMVSKLSLNPITIMRNIGSVLLIGTLDTGSKERKIFFYRESALTQAKGLDSLYEISNFFLAAGNYYFSGTAKPELDVRGIGIFSLSFTNKARRVYRKFGSIANAESYLDDIYVTGNFASYFNQNIKNNYILARIDDNFQRFYGRVFYDKNNDGTFNTGDIKAAEKTARISPYNALVQVDPLGFFTFIIPKGKSQLFKVVFDKTPEMQKSVSYIFNADTFTERLVLFPIQLSKADFSDIRVSISAAAGWKVRKDTSELYVVRISNKGVVAASPDVNLQFNGKLVLIKPFPSPDVINPGKITWVKQTLQPGEEKYYLVKLTTPSSDFAVNDEIGFKASTSNIADDFPADNFDSLSQTVSSGVMLNAKFQYPAEKNGDPTSYLLPDAGKIEYIIRFSNTQADTVRNIVVIDTISTPDYVTYIQETGASHSFTRNVTTQPQLPDKVIVSYTFSNINLPPNPGGNSEFTASSGYISFRLGLQSSLPSGTQLNNIATIYQDNYTPIQTNGVSAVVVSTATRSIQSSDYAVYPNPFDHVIHLNCNDCKGTFMLRDLAGREITQKPISNGLVDLSDLGLAPAPYAWSALIDNGTTASGIIIKK